MAPIVLAYVEGRRITPRHEIKPSPTYASRTIAAFEVFGWNCPSNFIMAGFKMMEGLSGISLGTWGQGEPRGWTLIKKPDAAGSGRDCCLHDARVNRTRKYS